MKSWPQTQTPSSIFTFKLSTGDDSDRSNNKKTNEKSEKKIKKINKVLCKKYLWHSKNGGKTVDRSSACIFLKFFEKSSNKSWKITILTWWASFEFDLILRAKSGWDREMMTSRHCTKKNYYLDGKYSDQTLRIFSVYF